MKKDDLFYTLEMCKNSLPPNTDRVHYERLERIKKIIDIYNRDRSLISLGICSICSTPVWVWEWYIKVKGTYYHMNCINDKE